MTVLSGLSQLISTFLSLEGEGGWELAKTIKFSKECIQ